MPIELLDNLADFTHCCNLKMQKMMIIHMKSLIKSKIVSLLFPVEVKANNNLLMRDVKIIKCIGVFEPRLAVNFESMDK